MTFSPPVVGCLVKKGLQKEGSRAPQDPPLATPLAIDGGFHIKQKRRCYAIVDATVFPVCLFYICTLQSTESI